MGTLLIFLLSAGEMYTTFTAIIAYNFITQLAPAFFASLMRRNFATKQGVFAGIITGGALVSFMDLGNIKIGQLFPYLPQAMKDLNEGIIALFVNIAVFVLSV